MTDYSEQAGLPPEAVRNHVLATAGWGWILERQATELLDATDASDATEADDARRQEGLRLAHSSASSYTIAASFAALYDPVLAEALFWSASHLYLAGPSPRLFGAVLAACTDDGSLRTRWVEEASRPDIASRDRLYALLTLLASWQAGGDRNAVGRLLDGSPAWRGAYLSELFVPASFFVDVLAALPLNGAGLVDGEGMATTLVNATNRLLTAFTDQTEATRATTVRWQTMRFLPVSPEVLAVLLLSKRYYRSGSTGAEGAENNERFGSMMRSIAADFLVISRASSSGRDAAVLDDLVMRRWG